MTESLFTTKMLHAMEKASAVPINRYRRFHGYDYTRGARLFLTTALAERSPVLGRVVWEACPPDGGPSAHHPLKAQVQLSPAGQAVQRALLDTPRFVPAVVLERYVIMPDHVHLLVKLRPGEPAPDKKYCAGARRRSRRMD